MMKSIFLILILVVSANAFAVEEFIQNGEIQAVILDTGTPGNSKPFPSLLLDSSGNIFDLSTLNQETTQQDVLASVSNSETLLGTINGKLPATLGQKTMANSLAVALASDQSALTINLPTGASTSALQTSGNASLTSIDGKLANNYGAASGAVRTASQLGNASGIADFSAGNASAQTLRTVIATDQSAVSTRFVSILSTANSSTTPLGAAGVFTGTSEEVKDYSSIEVSVFSNVASGTNGLSLQQSQDGTNWDFSDTYTVSASTGMMISVQPGARYFRIVYTNGAGAQATFRLQVVYHIGYVKSSTHRLADTISTQSDSELVTAQIRAVNGTNAVGLTADASSNLNVNIAAAASATLPASAVPAVCTVKQAAITVGTSAVRLTHDAAAPTSTRRFLKFMLDSASSANCFEGSSSVTSSGATRGVPAFPGAVAEYINDANEHYIICDAAAQTVFVKECE